LLATEAPGDKAPDTTELQVINDDDDGEDVGEDPISYLRSNQYDPTTDTFVEDSDDPTVAEYDILVNKNPDNRELYILQFVGRPRDKPLTGSDAPLEMRIKPESGFIEVDLPLDIYDKSYDRQKGIRFGEAIRKSKQLGQTAYGMQSGFQQAMPRSTKRQAAAADEEDADLDVDDEQPQPDTAIDDEDDDIAEYLKNFKDANEKGHVLNKVTWSGQISPRLSHAPIQMIGVFRGSELHLTPITATVKLYPEVTQIQALDHLEAVSKHKDSGEAKMMLAPNELGPKDTMFESGWQDYLRIAAGERWQKLEWIESESAEAYSAFEDRLFLEEDAETRQAVSIESVKDWADAVFGLVRPSKDSAYISGDSGEDSAED
jgi:DNA-directed RNA polymerase III subunit RPC5